jgi:hypothetical protein
MSILSTVAYKLFFCSVLYMVKTHLLAPSNECECYSKECVENVYREVYDRVNKLLDKLRRIILLQEVPSLVRVKI